MKIVDRRLGVDLNANVFIRTALNPHSSVQQGSSFMANQSLPGAPEFASTDTGYTCPAVVLSALFSFLSAGFRVSGSPTFSFLSSFCIAQPSQRCSPFQFPAQGSSSELPLPGTRGVGSGAARRDAESHLFIGYSKKFSTSRGTRPRRLCREIRRQHAAF